MHLSTNFGKEIQEKKSPGTNGLTTQPQKGVQLTPPPRKGVLLTPPPRKGVQLTPPPRKGVQLTSQPKEGVQLTPPPRKGVQFRVGHSVLFRSERSVLLRSKKRTLRSFPFFSRVFGDLWNPKECSVLFKRTEKKGKNVTFFLKERKRTQWTFRSF